MADEEPTTQPAICVACRSQPARVGVHLCTYCLTRRAKIAAVAYSRSVVSDPDLRVSLAVLLAEHMLSHAIHAEGCHWCESRKHAQASDV
jgi:hypothetical protein